MVGEINQLCEICRSICFRIGKNVTCLTSGGSIRVKAGEIIGTGE
jgi:hypothetical protein